MNVYVKKYLKIYLIAFAGDQMGLLASFIIGRFPITILDRIITSFAGFGLPLLFTKISKNIENKRGERD
ncbi:MAG: hypothetical protein K5829_06720 [Treponema sp.]|nr:hypothetical protein [Treponema sp.]